VRRARRHLQRASWPNAWHANVALRPVGIDENALDILARHPLGKGSTRTTHQPQRSLSGVVAARSPSASGFEHVSARLACRASHALRTVQKRYPLLSPREEEVMNLVVSGLTNKRVEGQPGISVITVGFP
jgi:ATP/maltotriose-dependent transcriptional regulator MalT